MNDGQFLEIDIIYLFFWGFYIVIPTAVYTFGDIDRLNLSLGGEYKEQFLGVMIASSISGGLGGLAYGLYFPFGNKIASALPRLEGQWNQWEAYLSGALYIAIGATLLVLFISTVGLSTYINTDYGSTYLIEAGWGYLLIGVFFLQIGILVVFLAGVKSRAHWLSFLLLIIFASMAFRTGRRRFVVEVILGLLVLQNFYVSRIKKSSLAIGLAIVMVFLVIVGQARAFSSGGTEAMWDYVIKDFNIQELSHLLDDGEGMYFVLSETIKYTQATDDYKYGQTFAEAFQVLVPKAFFPNRPLAPSEWFAQYYDSEYAAKGGGFSYTLMAEGYLNFGVIGVILVCFIQGIVINILYHYRRLNTKSLGRGLVYAVCVASVFGFMRSDFASMLKIYIINTGIPAIVIALWLGRRHSWSSSDNQNCMRGSQ